MSFKPLFSKSLGAAPGRLHFAAHSHHLWPDASFEGQVECWEDAARLADHKWDKVMGEVWPEAQAHVAAELGSGDPSAIVFASNTHDFLIRLAAACPRRGGSALRVLTSDGEFHSRAAAVGALGGRPARSSLTKVAAEPFDDFSERFLAAARSGEHDLILVSQVLFNSGRLFDGVDELAALARPEGPWVVIDGYHAFMAIERPIDAAIAGVRLLLGGGYKYAMAGEGMGFMHCPPGLRRAAADHRLVCRVRRSDRAARQQVGYTPRRDALHGRDVRSVGAVPVQRHPADAEREWHHHRARRGAGRTACRRSCSTRFAEPRWARRELLNPLDGGPHARFLAFRDPPGAALVRRADGAGLRHRRSRRRAAHRLRPLS